MQRFFRSFAAAGCVVLILLASPRSAVAQAAALPAKPAEARTATAPAALGAQQLADIAAKGVPAELPAPPAPRLASPAARAAFEAPLPAFTRRRLPGISEAMGALPREAWLRLAQRKPADRAWIGGRSIEAPAPRVAR